MREVLRLDSTGRNRYLNVGDVKSDLDTGNRIGTRGKRLSERYLAGLLDSDGCIMLNWFRATRNGGIGPDDVMRCYACVRFDQSKADGHGFISAVRASLVPPTADVAAWGKLAQSPDGCWSWCTSGSRAVSVLMRLRKYLVVHRHIADVALEMNGQTHVRHVGQALFAQARLVQPPLPKHPTRPWVAGYLDGNGSIEVRIPHDGMSAQVVMSACDEAKDRAGIDLLKKAFGGSVQEFTTKNGTAIAKWTLSMPPSKVKAMLDSDGKQGALAKHSIIRKDVLYFLLGCAKMGHFRDGETIRDGVLALKSQPHRLNDPSAAVHDWLQKVRDIPSFMGPGSAERKRQWAQA